MGAFPAVVFLRLPSAPDKFNTVKRQYRQSTLVELAPQSCVIEVAPDQHEFVGLNVIKSSLVK